MTHIKIILESLYKDLRIKKEIFNTSRELQFVSDELAHLKRKERLNNITRKEKQLLTRLKTRKALLLNKLLNMEK